MNDAHYELVITAPAARAIRETLPRIGRLCCHRLHHRVPLENPKRVGAPLRGELEGIWSARRGTYRILYRIDESNHEVIVLRVGHRRDIYRPR